MADPLNRTNHFGSQPISSVRGLEKELSEKQPVDPKLKALADATPRADAPKGQVPVFHGEERASFVKIGMGPGDLVTREIAERLLGDHARTGGGGTESVVNPNQVLKTDVAANVLWYGAKGDGGNDTAAIQAVLNRFPAVFIPPGIFGITKLIVPSKCLLFGVARASILKQLTTAGDVDPMTLIQDVSDVTIDSIEFRGIIAQFDYSRQTGTFPKPNNSEFNDAVQIRSLSGSTSRVMVRNCFFQDIRGDGVAVIKPPGGDVHDVTLKDLAGDNILRNGVSVVGGTRVRGVGLKFPRCGYTGVDCEPDSAFSAADDQCRFEDVDAAVVQIAANPDTYVANVSLKDINTDGNYSGTTPAYKNGAGVTQLDTSAGIRLRNTIGIEIDGHKARNHGAYAVQYIIDPTPIYATEPQIRLKRIDYDTSIGASESAKNTSILFENANGRLLIDGGKVTLLNDNKCLVQCSSVMGQRISLKNLSCDGRLVANASSVELDNVKVSASSTRSIFVSVDTITAINCPDLAAGSFGFSVEGVVFINSKFTLVGGGSVFTGTAPTVVPMVNSTIGSVTRAGFGFYGGSALTGWSTGTGTANKAAFAAYAGQTISGAYTQAEVQAVADAAKNASQRVLALEQAVRALTGNLNAT